VVGLQMVVVGALFRRHHPHPTLCSAMLKTL
jgi:hypothetical protein